MTDGRSRRSAPSTKQPDCSPASNVPRPVGRLALSSRYGAPRPHRTLRLFSGRAMRQNCSAATPCKLPQSIRRRHQSSFAQNEPITYRARDDHYNIIYQLIGRRRRRNFLSNDDGTCSLTMMEPDLLTNEFSIRWAFLTSNNFAVPNFFHQFCTSVPEIAMVEDWIATSA